MMYFSFHRVCLAAIILTGLIACSSSQDATTGSGPHSETVTMPLAAFGNSVRTLPTDTAPELRLPSSTDEAFAAEGSGSLALNCTEYGFDYNYQQDSNFGGYRLNLVSVEKLPNADAGCVPDNSAFGQAAESSVLAALAASPSLLSDRNDAYLHLYSSDPGRLVFQLPTPSQPEPDAAAQNVPEFTGTDWVIVSYRLGANLLSGSPAENPMTIRFAANGTVEGQSSCHSITGQYSTENTSSSDIIVNFHSVALQRKECPHSESTSPDDSYYIEDFADTLLRLMDGPVNAVLAGDRLYLRQNDTSLILSGRTVKPNERRLATRVLAAGEYPYSGNFDSPENQAAVVAVRQATELATLWNDAIVAGNPLGPVPQINFDKALVLYLRLGLRAHLGETMSIRSASTNDEYTLIEVDTRISDHDDPNLDSCGYDAALTHPFKFVLVSDSEALKSETRLIEHKQSSCTGL